MKLSILKITILSFFQLVFCMNAFGSAEYQSLFENKKVLVTGGTGTLGGAVVKEILKLNPLAVVIFSRDESKHFSFLESINFNPKVSTVVGDVRDYEALLHATKGVDIVIHCAALKRVDTIESNVEESVKTNVLGSINLFSACSKNKVKRAIYVSTDKSCSPISAYGAGKFLGEKVFSNYDKSKTSTIFACVRFGNIIGSTGSIVPIFFEKIKKGEDIPLTDERMTRFMITKEQAAQVIFDALKYSVGGEVFIKELQSVKIVDFIKIFVEKFNSKSKIVTVGIRQGERTYESLVSDVELSRAYQFKGNYIIVPSTKNWYNDLRTAGIVPEYLNADNILSAKFSKELSSDNFIISREELNLIFDSYNITQTSL